MEIPRLHAQRLRLRFRLDRRVQIHRPFLMQELLGHRMRERRPVRQRACKRMRFIHYGIGRYKAAEESPRQALVGGHDPAV